MGKPELSGFGRLSCAKAVIIGMSAFTAARAQKVFEITKMNLLYSKNR
jgi:hypothetical protein